MLRTFFGKMTGLTQSPPRVGGAEIFWSWLGSFLGVAAVAILHYHYFEGTDLILIIGSPGASAALIYGAVKSPLAQPRNLLGGHIISARHRRHHGEIVWPVYLVGRGLGRLPEASR